MIGMVANATAKFVENDYFILYFISYCTTGSFFIKVVNSWYKLVHIAVSHVELILLSKFK